MIPRDGRFTLLTREGEVEIAKRIERGQLSAMKALSRSPIVIQEVLAIGNGLKQGQRSIKETVVFDRGGNHREGSAGSLQRNYAMHRSDPPQLQGGPPLAEQLLIPAADKKTAGIAAADADSVARSIQSSLIIRSLG